MSTHLASGKPISAQQVDIERNFETLFKGNYQKLSWFANRYVNDIDVAQEIVAEVFTKLWEKRATLVVSVSLQNYLYRMVQNSCLNYLKHKKIENEYVNYLERADLLSEHMQDHLQQIHVKELKKQLHIAIDQLSPRCKEIFEMSRLQFLSNKQISQVLNISVKAVERQMTIALHKIRFQLSEFLSLVLMLYYTSLW